MKGQYLTIEYVLFFIIGVVLVTSVYFIFSNVNSIAERSTVVSQLNSVGESIRGTIINIYQITSKTESDVMYNLSIPPKLASCIYVINTTDKLNLNCTHDSSIGVSLSLYNLNITTKNIIYSTKGYVEIIALNQTVELK